MKSIKIKNISGITLYLLEYGFIKVLDNETVVLTSDDTTFANDTQLETLVAADDILIYDEFDNPLTSLKAQTVLDGVSTNLLAVRASYRMIIFGKKETTGTLNQLQPVVVTGYNGVTDEYTFEVADSLTTAIPAIGIIESETISDTVGGYVVVFGTIENCNTSSWLVDDLLYVGTSGSLTKIRPAGLSVVQAVAKVFTVGVTDGKILVFSSVFNTLPNLTEDYIWVGNGSGIPNEVLLTSITHGRLHDINSVLDHNPIPGSVLDNIVLFNADEGYPIKDSGFKLTDFALYTDTYSDFEKDDLEVSGNHIIPLVKLSWVIVAPSSGKYHFKWSTELAASKASQEVAVLVEMDDTLVINDASFATNTTNVFACFGSFDEVTLVGGTSYTFTLKYNSITANTIAYVRRTRMFIEYIST